MTFAEQVNIERKSYFLIRAKDVRLPTRHAIIFLVCNPGHRGTMASQACQDFLGLPEGQIKYLQVLIAVTESVCLT